MMESMKFNKSTVIEFSYIWLNNLKFVEHIKSNYFIQSVHFVPDFATLVLCWLGWLKPPPPAAPLSY
jgi:hypothetical protein